MHTSCRNFKRVAQTEEHHAISVGTTVHCIPSIILYQRSRYIGIVIHEVLSPFAYSLIDSPSYPLTVYYLAQVLSRDIIGFASITTSDATLHIMQ